MNTSEHEMLLYTYFIEHITNSGLKVSSMSLEEYEKYSKPFVIFLLLYILLKPDILQYVSDIEVETEFVNGKLAIISLVEPGIKKDICEYTDEFRRVVQASYSKLKTISLEDTTEFDRRAGRKITFIMDSLSEQELNELVLGIDDIAKRVKSNGISLIHMNELSPSYETVSYIANLMNRYPMFMVETCSILDWFGYRFITDKYSASLIKSWGFKNLGDETTGLVKQVRDLGLRNPVYITVDMHDNIILD